MKTPVKHTTATLHKHTRYIREILVLLIEMNIPVKHTTATLHKHTRYIREILVLLIEMNIPVKQQTNKQAVSISPHMWVFMTDCLLLLSNPRDKACRMAAGSTTCFKPLSSKAPFF